MEHAKRIGYMHKEFGLSYESGEWFYNGIGIIDHSYTSLSDALTKVMMITTWQEYSKICFEVGEGVSITLNRLVPLRIFVAESDWEETNELMIEMMDSMDWEISDTDGKFFVLTATYRILDMLTSYEN